MKTNILNIFAAGALMLGALSCSEEWNPPTSAEATLNLESLTVGTQDIDKLAQSASSRAEASLDDFIVLIKDASDKTYLECSYGKKPEIITLPVGDYTVYIKSHEVKAAEWDAPYFEGSEDFTIENGKINIIKDEVVAYFKSVRVSVEFSDELRATFGDDVKVNVKAGAEGEIDFTPSETRSAYFEYIEGSNTLVAELSGTIAGAYTVDRRDYTDVEAGKHYILTYGIKAGPTPPEQSGTIDSDISLDLSVITENIDGNVEASEDILAPEEGDRPVEEPLDPVVPVDPVNPGDDDQPVATFKPYDSPKLKLGETLDITNDESKANDKVVLAEEFGNAIVAIDCPKGIKNLEVTISTTDPNFRGILESMLPLHFDLADDSDADLVEALSGLGLPVGKEVTDVNPVMFDITSFIELLAPFTGEHTFDIKVTDNEGKTATDFLKFNAH